MNILHLSAVLLSIFKQTFCGVCFYGMMDANNFTDIAEFTSTMHNDKEIKMCTMQFSFTMSNIDIGFAPLYSSRDGNISENVTARKFGGCHCSYYKTDTEVNATHLHIGNPFWVCCYKAPPTGDLASALKEAQDFARSHKAEVNSLWAEFKDFPYHPEDVIRKEDVIPRIENKNNPRCKIEKGSSPKPSGGKGKGSSPKPSGGKGKGSSPKPSGGGTVSLVLLTLGLAYWYSKTE